MDILMRLKSSSFAAVANEFRAREKQLGGGLPLRDFVEIVLQGLPRETRSSPADKRASVGALVDLFDEIDINGDGAMDFDEFTSFCVDAGMVATTRGAGATSAAAGLKHRYVRSARHTIKTANGCVGVEKVKWSGEFRKLLAIENTAKTVKLYDITGKLVAEVGGASTLSMLPTTPRSNEGLQGANGGGGVGGGGAGAGRTSGRSSPTRMSGSSSGSGGGGHAHATSATSSGVPSTTSNANGGAGSGIFILDAVFIFKHQCLALSTTDFAISFYNMNESRKLPIAALLPDSAVAAAKCGPSFELLKPLTIATTTAQLLLRFCETADLLFSSGNDFVLNVWKILDLETKVLWKRLVLHQDMVMDIIEIPHHDLIVTCDLQRCIQLWDLHDCRPRGALAAHSHGVKQLVYSTHHDLLLSAGFEYDAYGWDIASRQVVMRLAGHRAPLVGVQIALFQTERAVTADCTGVFKVWDISRTNALGGGGSSSASRSSGGGGGGRGAASQAIQLESIDPSQHIARFEPTAFVCMHPHSRDLWVATAGTATLHRFRSVRVQQADEVPLRAFYHYNANRFVVVSGPVCSIWDGESGACLDEFTHVGDIGGGTPSSKENGAKARPRAGVASSRTHHPGGGSNVHNGADCSAGAEPRVEVLSCVQDRNCRKVVVVTERGDLGVFNALNFVQMRKCREVFYGTNQSSGANSSSNGASSSSDAAVATAATTTTPACGIVGLHYCSVNKLIVATDANESAILVIDDNTNQDAVRGAKETTVLRRLTHIPGGVAASAYGFHVCLVAIVSEPTSESSGADGSVLSLWDFETLSFVAHCDFERDPETPSGHQLHLLEFWDDFPVLLAADTLGGVYFFAAMPLVNCNTGKLLHSFANDRDATGATGARGGVGGGAARANGRHTKPGVTMSAVAEAEDEEEEPSEQQLEPTFITETTELAARKLLRFRKGSRVGAQSAAGHSSNSQQPSGCAVTAMRVVFDDANARHLLITGDERGVVRVWDLSGMIERLSLSKIPEIKCKYLRRGYHPKAMFTRDYMKDATSEESQKTASRRHQPTTLSQDDWRAALLSGDDRDPHFQLSQEDLKRLSRRRLESKKKSIALASSASSKQPTAAARAAQQAASANAAFAAATAFMGGQKKGGASGKAVGFSLGSSSSAKKRSFVPPRSAASSSSASSSSGRRHAKHEALNDVHLVHAWQAHSDGLTSLEVTKNPDIVVTCALDMRVFVWSWYGACLGKLFDAENVGRWKWQFAKDEAKRQAEHAQLVAELIEDLEMTPLEKAHKRRQTLFQEHTARKSVKDLQRVNTILLDHIISKNPELDLLKTEHEHGDDDEEGDTAPETSPQHDALVDLKAADAPLNHQPLTKLDPHPERSHLRTHSLAQVGPLLCVNRFEYKNQSLAAAERTKFVEQDDLTMDKTYLEQELAITFPTSLSGVPAGGGGSTVADVQSQIVAAHLAAEAAFKSRATLERKTAEMYANLEQVKQRTKHPSGGELRSIHGAADLEKLLEPSAFLKKHIPASDLAVRPQTAPAKHTKRAQQQLEKLSMSNQVGGDSVRGPSKPSWEGGERSVRAGVITFSSSNSKTLNGSASAPVLLHRRQSVMLDRRKSSMDIEFVEEVKRHTKRKPALSCAPIRSAKGSVRRGSVLDASVSNVHIRNACDGDEDAQLSASPPLGSATAAEDGDESAIGSLQKLRAINQILTRAQEYCSPAKEPSQTHIRPTTAPVSRLSAHRGSGASLTTASHADHEDAVAEETEEERAEREDSFEAEWATATDTGDAAAVVREHLEETKRKMLLAMRDGERSPHRSDLKKIRQSAQRQQKARRMEDYLQQKRRELNTNIGNVFKRTSFAFQSKTSDDPAAIQLANESKGHGQLKLEREAKAKVEMEKGTMVFGIYGVREVMAVIRLFWSMDEDCSGNISLEELLQYKHFFEKLGYNDMTTVFQAIDKDGSGHVSLKELLEICFHYATKYQIEEMLKLAKVGNVRTYLHGDSAGGSGGGSGGDSTAAALSSENRRELLEIFRVFDKDGDGGVSFQELMEALRVDDDDVIARVMAEQAAARKSKAHDATPSGITREDVERLYREFDSDENASLDFDEFIALMRTLYGPKSNVYFR